MKLQITLGTLLCALLQVQNLFCLSLTNMSEDEQKACGIAHLSSDEKQSLDAWLAKQQLPTQKPAPILDSSKIVHGEFTVVSNVNLGRFITLNNGITYDIPSRSRKKTMSWKVDDKVSLVEPINPTNFKLQNLAQKHAIGAKISKSSIKPVQHEIVAQAPRSE